MSSVLDLNDADGGTEIISKQWLEKIYPNFPIFSYFNWIVVPGKINIKENNIAWIHIGDHENNLEWITHPNINYLIFVSEYQKNNFIKRFKLDPNKCFVIKNATDVHGVDIFNSKIKIVNHSDIYRTSTVLLDAMNYVKDAELHIYSDLYDSRMTNIHSMIKDNIINHGRVSHEKILQEIKQYDIFAYPAMIPETSSLCLIEALSCGLYSIVSDTGALRETSNGHAVVYGPINDNKTHAKKLSELINKAILDIKFNRYNKLLIANSYSSLYSWETRMNDWKSFANSIRLDRQELI